MLACQHQQTEVSLFHSKWLRRKTLGKVQNGSLTSFTGSEQAWRATHTHDSYTSSTSRCPSPPVLNVIGMADCMGFLKPRIVKLSDGGPSSVTIHEINSRFVLAWPPHSAVYMYVCVYNPYVCM